MITADEYREHRLQVSRVRGVREDVPEPSKELLKAYGKRETKADTAALRKQGDRVMAARKQMGLETW